MQRRTIRIVEEPRRLVERLAGASSVRSVRGENDVTIYFKGSGEKALERVYAEMRVAEALQDGTLGYDIGRSGNLGEPLRNYVLGKRVDRLLGMREVDVKFRGAA